VSLLTFGADSENAVTVMKWFESIASDDFVLQQFNLLVVKLDQGAAFGADQVVVMSVFVLVLIEHSAIMKFEFASKAALLQELERTVHGRKPNRGIFCLNYRVEVLAGNMTFGFQKHVEYQIALAGSLKSCAFQVLLKDSLFFAFHNLPVGLVKIIHAQTERAKDDSEAFLSLRRPFGVRRPHARRFVCEISAALWILTSQDRLKPRRLTGIQSAGDISV